MDAGRSGPMRREFKVRHDWLPDNQPHSRKANLKSDMGASWVKPKPTLSHLAVRVKAMFPMSQSCLEVMILSLPGFIECHPVARMNPTGVEGNEDSLQPLGKEEAIGLCESSVCTPFVVVGRSYSAFDMRRRSDWAICMCSRPGELFRGSTDPPPLGVS